MRFSTAAEICGFAPHLVKKAIRAENALDDLRPVIRTIQNFAANRVTQQWKRGEWTVRLDCKQPGTIFATLTLPDDFPLRERDAADMRQVLADAGFTITIHPRGGLKMYALELPARPITVSELTGSQVWGK